MKKIIMSMLFVLGICGSVKPNAAVIAPMPVYMVSGPAIAQTWYQSFGSSLASDASKMINKAILMAIFSFITNSINKAISGASNNEVENPEESQRHQALQAMPQPEPQPKPVAAVAHGPVAKSQAQLNHEANIRARQQRRR